MKDLKKLKELILEKLDIAKVMEDYNVSFVFNPNHVDEVQFRCPFHGEDNKPSARLYKETNSAWCWVCRKRWDIISFVMDKENLSFRGALGHLIRKYKIDISSIPDGPTIEPLKEYSVPKIKKIMSEIEIEISDLKYKIPFEKYNIFCAVYDNIEFRMSKNHDVLSSAEKLKEKVFSYGKI